MAPREERRPRCFRGCGHGGHRDLCAVQLHPSRRAHWILGRLRRWHHVRYGHPQAALPTTSVTRGACCLGLFVKSPRFPQDCSGRTGSRAPGGAGPTERQVTLEAGRGGPYQEQLERQGDKVSVLAERSKPGAAQGVRGRGLAGQSPVRPGQVRRAAPVAPKSACPGRRTRSATSERRSAAKAPSPMPHDSRDH